MRGSYCETGDNPACWQGDAPVCYPPEAPISVRFCAQDPCVGVVCGVGGICDPTSGECVDCSTAYECVRGSYCETGDNPLCWGGDAPVCYEPTHPLSERYCPPEQACLCPQGFTPTPAGEACVQVTSVAATASPTQFTGCAAQPSSAYGWGGALFADTDGNPNNNRVVTPFFTSRLNDVGLWACAAGSSSSGTLPIGEWIGFSHCLDLARGGDFLVGIAGDNRVRLKVDGQVVFERNDSNTSNFNYWHIVKVSLTSGVHIIELSGLNDGVVASFGAEISGPFPAGSLATEGQQMAADYAGNIVFSTLDMRGQPFDIGEESGWSCPDSSYALNTCAPRPVCTQTLYEECGRELPVDECADGSSGCDVNAVCVDQPVGFLCKCKLGFEGDGVSCTPVPCPANASGAPKCACDPGFSGVLSFDAAANSWAGECLPVECQCPRGYVPTPEGDACVQEVSVPAVNQGAMLEVCKAPGSTAYGWAGALFEDSDGDTTNDRVMDPYWGVSGSTTQGRLNSVGIWACQSGGGGAMVPVNEWIGFSRCLDLPSAGDYLVGIAGDNRVRFKVDGQVVFELDSPATSNFNYWHVRRVSLSSGVHVVELFGKNDGSVAAFGAEISGPFPVGSLADEGARRLADYAGNILFSTEEMQGGRFDLGESSGWSCPEGQALNLCADVPVCSSLSYVGCVSR